MLTNYAFWVLEMNDAMYVFTFKTAFVYLAAKDIIWTTASVRREEFSVVTGNQSESDLVYRPNPALPGLAQCSL